MKLTRGLSMVPLVNSDTRSDRGVSVLTDPDGCDRIFFVTERASAGDVYEAKARPDPSGKCVWSEPKPLEGGEELNSKCVLNVNVFEDGKRMITNGPSVCDARVTIWEWSEKGEWRRKTDPSDPDVASLEMVNRWGDEEDERNRWLFYHFAGFRGRLGAHRW